MTLQAETRTAIERARDRYPLARSAILPALWAVQHERGLITPDAMTEIAGILQVAPSEVEAVSTFYSMYFQNQHGRHEVIVCINVSCETTADGAFTWSSTVECLGGCGGAPTMQVDHHFEENLTPERVDQILGALREAPAPNEDHAVEAGGVAGGSADAPKSAAARGPRSDRSREPRRVSSSG